MPVVSATYTVEPDEAHHTSPVRPVTSLTVPSVSMVTQRPPVPAATSLDPPVNSPTASEVHEPPDSVAAVETAGSRLICHLVHTSMPRDHR